MEIILRQAVEKDYIQIFNLVEKAFHSDPLSDHREQFLVERLRQSPTFIPQLSIVAQLQGEIVGYILLTNVKIKDNKKVFDSLCLAPIAVLPKAQGKRIGSQLILKAHHVAQELGYTSIVLVGHQTYYPRFGYKPASHYGISFPFEAPEKNCMAIELIFGGLNEVHGLVHFPKEFNL